MHRIDESAVPEVAPIPSGVSVLVLSNPQARAIDEEMLAGRLATLVPSSVTTIIIDVDSQVTTLDVLSAFPSVTNVIVNGAHIRTLKGLHGRRLDWLKIDTGKNRMRDLAGLRETTVDKLTVIDVSERDLSAISAARGVRTLELESAPALGAACLASLPLENLVLTKVRGTRLARRAGGACMLESFDIGRVERN